MRDTKLRLLVVVSTDPSDLYFANQLARRFSLAGIVLEHQRHPPDDRPRWQKASSLLFHPWELLHRSIDFLARQWHRGMMKHLLGEAPAEFGEDGLRLDPGIQAPVMRVAGKGHLNSPECVEWIHTLRPNLVVVCGASILESRILEIPSHGVLNLHGGLSQYYRGLFTTDWAIHNSEPEKIGATVHFVSKGIDDGKVVFQGRPKIGPDDHPNKLYEKVVKLGVEMMAAAIPAIESGRLHTPLEPPKGRLYLEREFTDRVKRRVWRRWRSVINAYLTKCAQLDAVIDAELINPFIFPVAESAARRSCTLAVSVDQP